ncbi:MAG: RNA methyltransferase [Spirochaetales bacterium]|nr:RNA methyltransferase [Spirochaetales bacterium]
MKISGKNDIFQMLVAVKTNRHKRSRFDEIFVEGIESIKQAMASPHVVLKKIIYRNFSALSDWAKKVIQNGAFPERVEMTEDLYRELSDKDEPAEIMITLACRKTPLEEAPLGAKPFIVVFDRPSDRGNLGSLIRSANAFGVDLLVTLGHGVDVFEPKVIRSSLGAVFRTRIAHAQSMAELERWLGRLKRETGLAVVGTDSSGETTPGEAALRPPVVLVIGNEAKGMSVGLKALADRLVRIPMRGDVNSLNAACAGSILLWEIFNSISH